MANNSYVNKVIYGGDTLVDLTNDDLTNDYLSTDYLTANYFRNFSK